MSLTTRIGARGVALLRIAVMRVLCDAAEKGECLGAAEIARRANIFREAKWARKSGNDDIVWGVLGSLAKTGHVSRCTKVDGRNGWTVSDGVRQQMEKAKPWGGDNMLIRFLRDRQHGLCAACLAPLGSDVQVDHIVARAAGGLDTPDNKWLLHQSCNGSKGKRPFDEWLADKFGGDPRTDFNADDGEHKGTLL